MARSHLTVLDDWSACIRCERSTSRLGVLAPPEREDARVIVLATAASRSSQACGVADPTVLRLAERIRVDLRLAPEDCIADVLVACGMGDVRADHVAACSFRFAARKAPLRLTAIAFADVDAERLAQRAGLHDGTWWLDGPLHGTPVYPLARDYRGSLEAIGRLLGPSHLIAPAHLTQVSPPDRTTKRFLNALGDHEGCRIRSPDGAWATHVRRRLDVVGVHGHLSGGPIVAPFRPEGPWPYVVVDVDRHNAVQEREFIQTCKRIRKLFPRSLEVVSSASEGRHFYIRLPPEITYVRAALVIGTYLAREGVMWSAELATRTQLLEVPEHPPRLPFGAGSRLAQPPGRGITDIQAFLDFLQRANHRDFSRAEAKVYADLKLRKGKWARGYREKARRHILRAELRGHAFVDLPHDDPWHAILANLDAPHRIVAATGVPSYGSRTRWTLLLSKALRRLVGPEDARELLLFWLRRRSHRSEDIALRLASAERQTFEIVRRTYRRGGVPERAWQIARSWVDGHAHSRRTEFPDWTFWRPTADLMRAPMDLNFEDARRTAFAILDRFYSLGTRERYISHREFGLHGGRNAASDIEVILTSDRGWLALTKRYVIGEHSRAYCLGDGLWPARPGESRLFAYPR